MQINNHIPPSHFGHGSRPDHAANASGRGHQFQPAAADTEPAAATDTTTAVTPAEETEGPSIPGKSVAHRARAEMAQLSGLLTTDGHNFGWLVSQIARGMFELSDYTTEGDGTDGAEAGTDGVDATTPTDDTGATGEEGAPADETADAGTTPVPDAEDPVASLLDTLTEGGGEGTTPSGDETIDPVVDLVDTLLDDSEDDSEVT